MKRTHLYEGESLADKVADARGWLGEMDRRSMEHLAKRLVGRAHARMNPPETCHVRAALTMLDDVTAERDRLRALLDAETGRGGPEGWRCRIRDNAVRWVRDGSQRPGRVCDIVQHTSDDRARVEWHWWDRDVDIDGDVGSTHAEGRAPTALEAMEAAARRGRMDDAR